MSRSWPHHPTDPADPSRHCQLALPEPRVGSADTRDASVQGSGRGAITG